MKNLEKTDWFPPSVKPVHVGIYERRDTPRTGHFGGTHYSFWNGKNWGSSGNSIEGAQEWGVIDSMEQFTIWRGVKK